MCSWRFVCELDGEASSQPSVGTGAAPAVLAILAEQVVMAVSALSPAAVGLFILALSV